MQTLGVDLASKPENTGLCIVEWRPGHAIVQKLVMGVDDRAILDAAKDCTAIGIDAPFGWPDPFVEFLARAPGVQPAQTWSSERRDELRYRETDRHVRRQAGRWPLSVSSDLIAVAAMRCAGLLADLEVADRSGDGHIFEVYPAGALTRWKFSFAGYKSKNKERSSEVFRGLVNDLNRRAGWIEIVSHEMRRLLGSNTDAFDALICALVARAAALELTDRPPADVETLAHREGWIHLPNEDSFDRLTDLPPVS